MKRLLYKLLGFSNDIKAVKKGRILQRIWNRTIMKTTRRFLK